MRIAPRTMLCGTAYHSSAALAGTALTNCAIVHCRRGQGVAGHRHVGSND